MGLRPVLPERSNILFLKSLIARWESLFQGPNDNMCRIRFSWISNDGWSSLLNDEQANQGTIHLDCKPLPTSVFLPELGEDYPQSGYAVLLMGRFGKSRGEFSSSDWLAIRKVNDEKYLREGLITWPGPMSLLPGDIATIPEEGMTTVCLG
jgi:hypothetical protein